MKKSNKSKRMNASGDVSIRRTMAKTAALVILTVMLMAAGRFIKPIAHGINWVARTQAWQSLYSVLGADSAVQREKLIVTGIAFTCFVVAFVLVEIGDRVLMREKY